MSIKSSLSLSLSVLAIFGLGQTCCAQSEENPVDSPYITGDLKLTVLIGTLIPGQKVSGTNVGCSAVGQTTQPEAGEGPIHNPGIHWIFPAITAVKVKIGTETLTMPPVIINSGAYNRPIRFASTHFVNGNLPVEVKLKWELRETEASVPLVIWVRKQITVEVYNKLFSYGTKEEWNETVDPPAYTNPSPYQPPKFPTASVDLVSIVKPIFAGAESNHVDIGPGDPQEWMENTTAQRIDEKLKLATLFVPCTHGESSNFRASVTDQLFFNPLASSEVHGYVVDSRTVPFPNLVLMYGCDTMAVNTSNNAPRSFKILEPYMSGYVPDRGYAGYSALVFYQLYGSAQLLLGKHAEELGKLLVAGIPLAYAVEWVFEGLWFPAKWGPQPPVTPPIQRKARDYNGNSLKMIVRGDPMTRISLVYLTEAEWLAIPWTNPTEPWRQKSSWYLVP